VEFLPSAFALSAIDDVFPGECVVVAMLGQFSGQAIVMWYLVISIMAFLLLYGCSTSDIENGFGSFRQHMLVWFVSGITTLLPLVDGSYGSVGGSNEDSSQCWIKGDSNPFRALVWGLQLMCMGFDIFLFFFTIYVYLWLKRRHGGLLKPAWKTIVLQMLAFVGVFVGVWSMPCLNRLLWLFRNVESPDWIWMTGQIEIGLFGLLNFIIFSMQVRAGNPLIQIPIEINDPSQKHETSFFGAPSNLSEHLVEPPEHIDSESSESSQPKWKPVSYHGEVRFSADDRDLDDHIFLRLPEESVSVPSRPVRAPDASIN